VGTASAAASGAPDTTEPLRLRRKESVSGGLRGASAGQKRPGR